MKKANQISCDILPKFSWTISYQEIILPTEGCMEEIKYQILWEGNISWKNLPLSLKLPLTSKQIGRFLKIIYGLLRIYELYNTPSGRISTHFDRTSSRLSKKSGVCFVICSNVRLENKYLPTSFTIVYIRLNMTNGKFYYIFIAIIALNKRCLCVKCVNHVVLRGRYTV